MRLLCDERGSVMVAAMLLVAAMVVDLGTAQIMKARLQTAVDAATLAAVQETRVEVTRDVQRVTRTEYFRVGKELPEERFIIYKRPDYESRPVWGWEFDGEDWYWTIVGYEDVLVGWWIEHIVEYSDVKVEYRLDLGDLEARQAAQEAFELNAEQLRRESRGLVLAGPFLGDGEVTVTPRAAYYKVRGAVLWFQSLLMGPLGGSSWMTVRAGEYESAARVGG